MTLDEAITKEIRLVYKYRDRAWKARSAKITQERTAEADYHEQLKKWLIELKQRRYEK